MLPDRQVCERAHRERDVRFDGQLFAAVRTTGIYCRPVCRVRAPALANVQYLPSAAAAEAQGYRPCLRCCPERAPSPGSREPRVAAVLDALATGLPLADVLMRSGMQRAQLDRLLQYHLGASLAALVRTRRLHVARRLLDGTALPVARVAALSGFATGSALAAAVRRTWQRSPTRLRGLRRHLGRPPSGGPEPALPVSVPLRAPYDAGFVLAFLGRRALAGIEAVQSGSWVRQLGAADARVRVTPGSGCLGVGLQGVASADVEPVLAGVHATFDPEFDSAAAARLLARDPLLAVAVGRWPGMRVPGTMAPFELAVRAVLGQQVSVAAATTLAQRLVQRFGTRLDDAGACWRFPGPDALAGVDVAAAIGMPRQRGAAIAELARRTVAGDVSFQADTPTLVEALQAVPGIGAWTAQYVAMRALRDPDAFIDGDLIVRRGMGFDARSRRRDVLARAEAWRPWRAHAVMYLWRMTAQDPRSRA